jgi:hypothetical protein
MSLVPLNSLKLKERRTAVDVVLGDNTGCLKHGLVLVQTVTELVLEAGKILEPFVHCLVMAPDMTLEPFHFRSIKIIWRADGQDSAVSAVSNGKLVGWNQINQVTTEDLHVMSAASEWTIDPHNATSLDADPHFTLGSRAFEFVREPSWIAPSGFLDSAVDSINKDGEDIASALLLRIPDDLAWFQKGDLGDAMPNPLSHRLFIFVKSPSQSALSWAFFQKEECPKKMVNVGSFRDASSSNVCCVQIIPQLRAALGQSTAQAFEASKLSPCCSPLRREAPNSKAVLQRKSFIDVGRHQRALRCQRKCE